MTGERSHKEARDYWDTHDIPEDAPEVEVTVKRGPTTVLSVRIDRERLERLKKMAAAEEIGVVTMARRLLSQAIDRAAAPPGTACAPVGSSASASLWANSIPDGGALTLTFEGAESILAWSASIREVVQNLVMEAEGYVSATSLARLARDARRDALRRARLDP